MADEIQRLIMQVENKAAVDDLTRAIEREEQALAELIRQQQRGAIAAADYARESRAIGGNLQNLQGQLGNAQKGQRDYGQSILFASYALQDFTSVQGSFLQKLSS